MFPPINPPPRQAGMYLIRGTVGEGYVKVSLHKLIYYAELYRNKGMKLRVLL